MNRRHHHEKDASFSRIGPIQVQAPLSDETITNLKTGDPVRISGVLYTCRDAAHKRLVETIRLGKEPPFPLKGQVLFYAGFTPPPPDRAVGAIGPTTSYRMDPYTPTLLSHGIRGMIGKGNRSSQVVAAMVQYRAVYFGAVGGVAALLSRCVRRAEPVAYEDLQAETIYRLEVEGLPAIVINDVHGHDYYQANIGRFLRTVPLPGAET
jgi:fumarate hydratase subunit beta